MFIKVSDAIAPISGYAIADLYMVIKVSDVILLSQIMPSLILNGYKSLRCHTSISGYVIPDFYIFITVSDAILLFYVLPFPDLYMVIQVSKLAFWTKCIRSVEDQSSNISIKPMSTYLQ